MTRAAGRVRGSHAPSLTTLVRRELVSAALPKGATILAACSGGPDSTAMLHALALLREKLDFSVVAHGVDHGLRLEAAVELELAAENAERFGVRFERTRVDVPVGGNLQARAREARYEALRTAARAASASVIATGHTANDRAETLIMRLVRGTGPRGLAVLPARSEDLFRPLIRATTKDVALHLARHGVAVATDPSNVDRRFLRARVRAEIMPLLASLSPKAVQAICALADDMVALRSTLEERSNVSMK
jgi:tRNA(Ile)-lysidine synthase